MSGQQSCSPGSMDALKEYISDWARIIWDATGDQTKVDQAILLADLNGMFDPVKVAGLTGVAQRHPDRGTPIGYISPITLAALQNTAEGHGFVVACAGYDTTIPLYVSPPSPVLGEETDDQIDERLAKQEAGDNLRLLDYIADKIGIPHNEELSRENFNSWLSSVSSTDGGAP